MNKYFSFSLYKCGIIGKFEHFLHDKILKAYKISFVGEIWIIYLQ